MKRKFLTLGVSALTLAAAGPVAFADDEADARIEALESRIEQLEETNRRLLAYLESQGALSGAPAAHQAPHAGHTGHAGHGAMVPIPSRPAMRLRRWRMRTIMWRIMATA